MSAPALSRSTFLRSTLLGLAASFVPRTSAAAPTFSSRAAPMVADAAGAAPAAAASETAARPAGWSEASHARIAQPNLDHVFPSLYVNQVQITIAPANWRAMQDNMIQLFGPRGTASEARSRPVLKPIWIPATIEFDEKTWPNIGIRFKGNSSLRGAWNAGTNRLPLKLDFDQFEDQHPEIKNQRFYGIKQLSLAINWTDPTHLCESLVYSLLERAGLVAARTAPYYLTLDTGDGPTSLGLYTAIEVIDDTLIPRSFKDAGGNIYEAEGPGATLAAGTTALIERSFQKENNTKQADWSDIERLHRVLHASERSSHPAWWRSALESIFDVDVFLRWLGIAAVVQHWDTYGSVPHNFYLYNNPASGRLTWISWDHNFVFGNGGTPPISLDRRVIGDDWPLIRFLLDDPVYSRRYIAFMREFVSDFFVPSALEREVRRMATNRAPFATQETSAAEYESAVQDLITRLYAYAKTATDFLASHR